jgi:hypothetical protein
VRHGSKVPFRAARAAHRFLFDAALPARNTGSERREEEGKRAVVCHALGAPEDLVAEEVPSPPLTPGGVRIAVSAAGINFADTLIIAGQYQHT